MRPLSDATLRRYSATQLWAHVMRHAGDTYRREAGGAVHELAGEHYRYVCDERDHVAAREAYLRLHGSAQLRVFWGL